MDPVTALTVGSWIAAAAAPVAKGISGIFRYARSKLAPVSYQRNQALQRANITPEQYELRRRNLSEGLAALQAPGQIYAPATPQLGQPEDIAGQLPTQLGEQVMPQRPGGLAAILNNLRAQAQTGYQTDIAQIGARQRVGRNVLGRTSGEAGMFREALINRGTGYTNEAMKLLGDYARRNAIADIESGQTNVEQSAQERQLQQLVAQMQQAQQQGIQSQYLGEQQQNLGESQLRNILEGERYQQGLRKYNIGMNSPYGAPQNPSLGGI